MLIRSLKGYNFQTLSSEVFRTRIINVPCGSSFFSVQVTGALIVEAGYAWDGPSRPAIKTRNFLIPSLVHDVYYQAMRENLLPRSERKNVDRELRRMCLLSGMNKFRAWYVYKWCRLFGAKSAKPRKHPRGKIIEVAIKLCKSTKS